MNQPPRITIDTNCIINLLGTSSPSATSVQSLGELIRYAMDGKITIAATTRVESDLLKDRNQGRRAEMLRILIHIPIIRSIRGAAEKADPAMARLREEIQQILSPGLSPDTPRYENKINDIDHLTGHWNDERDFFVTDDKGILKRHEQLKSGPGIVVQTPAECVARIEEIETRSRTQILPSDNLIPEYHSRAFSGTVTFDYANNNHRFAIGNGRALFETQWSKASKTAIYAYNDPPSISGAALVKGVSEIANVHDIAALDFSSRDRQVQRGQLLIWRNVNCLYAATKITDIKDDTRSDDIDELTFDYVILPDGSTDFSKTK